MIISNTKIRLDPAHRIAVVFVFAVAAILAFICLELLRWRTQQNLIAAGFSAWGDPGYFIRDTPGQSLALTSLPSQLVIAMAAAMAGLAGAMLCTVAAALDMHLPFAMVSRATVSAFLFLPLSGLLIYMVMQTPACLTIDLSQNILSVTPGNTALNLPSIAQFNSYQVGFGKSRHEELGAMLTTGQQVDLITVSSWSTGNDIGQALQQFIGSNGLAFPAS